MSEVTIWVESGQLCIGCGRSLWRGDVEGAAVLAAVQLNDAAKAVLLLDQKSGQGDLVCVDSNAKVLWRATHPGDQDWWTSVQVVSGRVLANTWFGFRLELDSENGECLSQTFVK